MKSSKKRMLSAMLTLFMSMTMILGCLNPTYAASNVQRIAGNDRYETSLKIADATKEYSSQKFGIVILASGKSYPDALTGSFLSCKAFSNAPVPIILVDDEHLDSVDSYLSRNLLSRGRIYILGGTSAVSAKVENRFKGRYSQVIRLSGNTRYETNMRIIEEALIAPHRADPVDPDDEYTGTIEELNEETVYVCSGDGYADSLSVSVQRSPILLVDSKKGITDKQLRFLRDKEAEDFVIVGGTKAVPYSVEKKLRQQGYTVNRIAGKTRYETSAMLSSGYDRSNLYRPKVVLAYGENYPDGLCAAPLVYSKSKYGDDIFLLLCDNKNTASARKIVKGYGITNGIVVGGTGLISDKAVNDILR